MIKKVLLFQAFASISCVSTKSEISPTSSWSNLASAQSVGCMTWPVAEKELEVTGIQAVLNGDQRGFLTSVRQRNGNLLHTFIPYSGGQTLDTDNALGLPLGGQVLMAGATSVAGQKVFFVARNRGQLSSLEVRALADNRVLAKSPFQLPEDVVDATLTSDGESVWLSVRYSEAQTGFIKITFSNGKWNFIKARYVSESRGAQLVVDRERHNALIVEGAPASEEKAGLKFQTLGNLGELIRTDIIDFEVKGGLESWAVTSGRGETLVALITGDSMIGQSILHIGSINLRQEVPTWGWRKELPLPDIHVSEPVWIETTGVSPVLTIMKWVDAEATLGLYRVAANTVKQYPDQGIHRKGSIVSTGFEDAHDIRLTAILRHREGDIWKFELCKIKI